MLPAAYDATRAVDRAIAAAKAKTKSTASDDLVGPAEFRLLLLHLRQYFDLHVMFDQLDANKDAKLSLEEFKVAVQKLESWGIRAPSKDGTRFDAEYEYTHNFQHDASGQVSFESFAEWATQRHLDMEEDVDEC
eukprot:GDKI01042407.1.p1 GENE.GDKI01042407.1~~GDKI01042407.1.p1  ORF type:complete len:134 (-),score=25.32 GDKI01042407.1:22-423(-)